jgi:hypothetical protein
MAIAELLAFYKNVSPTNELRDARISSSRFGSRILDVFKAKMMAAKENTEASSQTFG